MKIKRDYSHLPIDEQIKKLERNIKFYFYFSIFWGVFIIGLSLYLIIFTPLWELGAGTLFMLPFSLWLGGYRQTKDAKEEIKKLEEQKKNEEQNEQKEQN